MNKLTIFSNPEFGDVRTVAINSEPWFVGKDIAIILGYSNYRDAINRHVDIEDRGVAKCDTLGGVQDLIIINESGLYSLIFGSKLETAKKFKHWVTSEVLPSIRKNGGYIQNQEQLTPEQIVATALIVANNIIAEKDSQIKEMQPKADYFDNLVDSKLLTTFRDTAKEFHIPPRQLTDWLVENGYIYRDKHKALKPYEKYRKSGLFQMKDFSTPFGYSNVQTYVTVKGKETFRLLLGVEN